MNIERQSWSKRDMTPFNNNECDLLIVEDAPDNQVAIYNFLSDQYEIGPQTPMNQMVVSIVSDLDKKSKSDLRGTTELAWHIDGAYHHKPYDMVALYALKATEESGETLFVDTRIEDLYPEYFVKHADTWIDFDIERFMEAKRTGKTGNFFQKDESQDKFFNTYNGVSHKLVQEDKEGKYLFYQESYAIYDETEKLQDLIYSEDRIYKHKWKPGEICITNNKATNHKRLSSDCKGRHLWKYCFYDKAV